MKLKNIAKKLFLLSALLLCGTAFAQQPQTSNAPIQPLNAKYVQGVGMGYWPTPGSGLTLNIAAGTVVCGGTTTISYAGGSLTMSGSTTNYVYLDTTASCAPASNTTGFTSSGIPIAIVVAGSGSITSIQDVRSPFNAAPSGTTKPLTTDSNFYVSINGSDSNDGLSWGSAFLTISKAFSSLSANGGHIWIGCGTFSYGMAPNLTISGAIVSGSGWGQSNNSNGCTILHPASGVDGLDVTGANYVVLEDFRILSASSGAGSDQGIHVSGISIRPTIRNVTVEHTGSHGINLDSSSAGNVDGWELDHVSVLSAFGDCFEFTGGNDTNVGKADTLDAIGCTGNGYKGAGGNGPRSNVFINLHASGNTAGDYNFAVGSSNKFLGVYSESGASSQFTFGASATQNEVWFAQFGQPTTITNTGGTSNVIHYFDSSNAPVQNGVNVAAAPGATTPITWQLLSGSFNNGWFSLHEKNDNGDAFTCVNGATPTCSFNNGPLTTPSLASTGGNAFGASATNNGGGCETSFGITTLNTGATTTNTGVSCLPANAIIDAVVYRITTTITTAANFTIGDATIAARFCSTQSTLTAGTVGTCFLQADQTGTSGPRQTSAAAVRVTTNVNPGAGAMRIIVFYHTWTPPTS